MPQIAFFEGSPLLSQLRSAAGWAFRPPSESVNQSPVHKWPGTDFLLLAALNLEAKVLIDAVSNSLYHLMLHFLILHGVVVALIGHKTHL